MMTNQFIVAVSIANIRRDPDPESELVTQALMNVPVIAGETAGDWTHVTLSDYSGWILTNQLDTPIVKGYCEGEGTCGIPLPRASLSRLSTQWEGSYPIRITTKPPFTRM